jgi:uncharacterized membrane protein (UPF0127 family)
MIRNSTRGTVLCRKTEMAESFFRKARGLMFRKSLGRDSGMLFVFSRPGRFSFWTPFMRFPIDIVFMDSSKRVVDVREGLGPWRACRPRGSARYALELRAGTARRTGTGTGDLLEFRA